MIEQWVCPKCEMTVDVKVSYSDTIPFVVAFGECSCGYCLTESDYDPLNIVID